jgi:AcrR family transcriptional regulator
VSTAAPLESDRPGGPRSRKGVETRARLIEAAKQVFEEDGFLEARVSDIAEGAGLSHGSFYHYFDSKEQIFREVAAEVDERLSEPLGEVVLSPSSAGLAPAERLREAIRRHFESYQGEARIMGVIEQVSRYDEELNALRSARHRGYRDRIAASIRQLQRRGMADRSLDPEVAAAALGAMTLRFAEMWLVQHFVDCTLDDAVDQVAVLFANALKLGEGTVGAATRRRRPVG